MAHSTQHLGAKLGPRLADLMAKGATSHLAQSADVRARVHKAGLDAFWQSVGREYRQAFGAHLSRIAESPDVHPEVKPLLKFVASQPGEGAAMLGTLWYGTGLGQTFGSIISNLLAPAIHRELAGAPNSLLPPDLLAQLAARGIYSVGDAESEARGGAIASWRFDRMVEGSRQYPDAAMAFDLLRRGLIAPHDLYLALQRAGYNDTFITAIAELVHVPLQAADLADMTIRGILTEQQARDRAKLVGVKAEDLDLLALQAGEPPGPEQLVEALRRGFIDKTRFDHGIRQSRIRNEWIDVEQKLGFVPMSTPEAVEAVVQGHLSDQQGRDIAHQNGLEPQHWAPLVETAGSPIARGEALELLNRGEMNRAQVEQAVRESRVKNKYIPDILKLRRRLPPERSIVSMLSHGAIGHDEALSLLMQLGFDRRIAEAFVKAGTAQRTGGAKHVALGVIVELHADQAIDQAEALRMLHALGWSDHDARLELRVGELRREHQWRQAAATRIGTDYVSRLIDRTEVIGYLDHIGLPALQRDRLLELWDLERHARRRKLTEAQVHAAAKRGAIKVTDAHARLVAMGYSDGDAHILLSDLGG